MPNYELSLGKISSLFCKSENETTKNSLLSLSMFAVCQLHWGPYGSQHCPQGSSKGSTLRRLRHPGSAAAAGLLGKSWGCLATAMTAAPWRGYTLADCHPAQHRGHCWGHKEQQVLCSDSNSAASPLGKLWHKEH